jgi:alkylation response protein AidB-like acyl-CoA dehydrogenase
VFPPRTGNHSYALKIGRDLLSFYALHRILRLASEGEGFKIAMAGLDGGRLNIGSCSLGAAQACFEIALDYVKVLRSNRRCLCAMELNQVHMT